MRKTYTCLGILFLAKIISAQIFPEQIIYAYPPTDVINDSSAKALVENCFNAGITDIMLLIKDPSGYIYFHSDNYRNVLKPGYENFDPLDAVIRESHKVGIKVHAWFCNFPEGANNEVMKLHPEWAMLNPEGKTTSESEFLGNDVRYYMTWMCPARRPGYADQWLLPMMIDVVEKYEVDGVHHDYVRYPGDVAPDNYCFCDYCIDKIPKKAHLFYESFKGTSFEITPTLPKIEANWWSDPTIIPENWFDWDRKKKADFLIKGKFIEGGPNDMDYYFYTFRTDAITKFVKETSEKLKSIKPSLIITASVFKNPVTSGRFIGQQWIDFAQYIDIMMPMVYRSHFPQTDFDTFLKLFSEYVDMEYDWIGNRSELSIVIDAHYIFNEERLFPISAIQKIDSLEQASEEKRKQLIKEIKTGYFKIKDHLQKTAPKISEKLSLLLNVSSNENKDELRKIFNELNNNPPEEYYPKEKLQQLIQILKNKGAESISIFNYKGIDLRKLWPVLTGNK